MSNACFIVNLLDATVRSQKLPPIHFRRSSATLNSCNKGSDFLPTLCFSNFGHCNSLFRQSFGSYRYGWRLTVEKRFGCGVLFTACG